MKIQAWLFAGIALFMLTVAVVYGWWSKEPAACWCR